MRRGILALCARSVLTPFAVIIRVFFPLTVLQNFLLNLLIISSAEAQNCKK